MQGGGDGSSRLEIPPPSPARKSPPGSLAETPRGGGEHRPPPSSPPLPPPSPSSLRGALVPPACRDRRAAAPATALRSFFFFLLSVAHDLLAPSGETPPAPALPAAEGHRGQALPYARRCGRIHNSRGNTDRPPPPIPCRSLPPPPAAAASRRPAQRQPASPPASAPRPRRRDSADRSSHDRSQAGAAPRRRDFAERKQVPGHPAALGRPGRVCAERSPGRLTRWRDSSARSCPLNARDSPPWGRVVGGSCASRVGGGGLGAPSTFVLASVRRQVPPSAEGVGTATSAPPGAPEPRHLLPPPFLLPRRCLTRGI